MTTHASLTSGVLATEPFQNEGVDSASLAQEMKITSGV